MNKENPDEWYKLFSRLRKKANCRLRYDIFSRSISAMILLDPSIFELGLISYYERLCQKLGLRMSLDESGEFKLTGADSGIDLSLAKTTKQVLRLLTELTDIYPMDESYVLFFGNSEFESSSVVVPLGGSVSLSQYTRLSECSNSYGYSCELLGTRFVIIPRL